MSTVSRLRERYRSEILPSLGKDLGYENLLQLPRLDTVVINMGLGAAIQNAKVLDSAGAELPALAGPRPLAAALAADPRVGYVFEGLSVGLDGLVLANGRMTTAQAL